MMELETGHVYRRRDLHEKFGGQQQGGISTPSKPNVILLFTGPTGTNHGYRDMWTEDDRFHYTGDGQSGDMELVRGNRAIRDHEKNDKILLLFESVAKGQVKYLGEMRYVNRRFVDGEDVDGKLRRSLVFELEPVDPEATRNAREAGSARRSWAVFATT